jgi:hypothetical protein
MAYAIRTPRKRYGLRHTRFPRRFSLAFGQLNTRRVF